MSGAPAVAKALTHEEVFLQRYDQLFKWATQLTKPDRELARDLVQESFLQFVLSTCELTAINNIDNYLYGLVRNTYISYLRRSARHLHIPFDLQVIESSQLTSDPFQQIQARDKLLTICQYACARKETSVAASLLILRFFHGYLPTEIAKLTRRSRNVVDVQLKLARLEFGEGANYKAVSKKSNLRQLRRFRSTTDLLTDLRKEIFATRKGECLDAEQFEKIRNYRNPVSRSKVSHLVSCFVCLERANHILGLPSLKDRNALDALGRATGDVRSRLYPVLDSALFVLSWTIWTILADVLTDFADVLT